jgi:hypothetical protein
MIRIIEAIKIINMPMILTIEIFSPRYLWEINMLNT